MAEKSIPKPTFASCDETSLTIKWDNIPIVAFQKLKIQYKEVFEPWELSKDFEVKPNGENSTKILFDKAALVDLKPGTAYSIRLLVVVNENSVLIGPETVFDTKPIDCTPKKKCTIS